MPDRSAIGANAYALPDNRYIQQQQTGAPQQDGAVPFFELPKQNDGLAYVEGLTDKYYNTKATIEAYAMDMWKKYGVDVTQPDTSQLGQGGGTPFKSYQKLATQLLLTANDLKASMKRQEALEPYYASGQIEAVDGFDQTKQPINRMAPGDMYSSTDLLPEAIQANEILKTAVHTDEDYQRFKTQVTDPLVTRWKKQMNGASPGKKAQIQRSIDSLVQAPKTTPYATFQNSGKNKPFEIDFTKKVANTIRGKWGKDFKVKTDEDGNPVLVNSAFNGKRAGTYTYTDAKGAEKTIGQFVDGIVKNKDNRFIMKFKQGEEGSVEIPPLDVTDMSADEIAAMFMGSNPKNGDVTKLYTAMRELGLADDNGSLLEDKVLAGKEFDAPDASVYSAGITAEKKRINERLSSAANPGWVGKNTTISFVFPDGVTQKISKNRTGDEGWYIEDAADDTPEHMTNAEVIKWLGKNHYFDQFITEPEEATTTAPPGAVPTIPSLKEQIVPPNLRNPTQAPVTQAADTTTVAPKFKVAGESGTQNMHPWAIRIGNLLTDSLGGKAEFNSVYRTDENNKKVGGKPNSFHLLGAGLDIKPADWKKISDAIKKRLVAEFGAQIIDEGDHIHIEPKNKEALNQSDTLKTRAADLIAKYRK